VFTRCAPRKRPGNAKTPPCWGGVLGCGMRSLTITYFHTGIRTIIGVESFHGPVRDGKGWYQLAMVIRHDLLSGALGERPNQLGRSSAEDAFRYRSGVMRAVRIVHNNDLNRGARGTACAVRGELRTVPKHTGYRIKPYGQLVSVSLMHYCTSTPDLSTSWSRTTLQGARSSRDISSQGEFPA
jgi:hypothetical protein